MKHYPPAGGLTLEQRYIIKSMLKIGYSQSETPSIHDAFDTVMEVTAQIRMDFLDLPPVIYRNISDEEKYEIKKVAKRWDFILPEDDPGYNDYDEIMNELTLKRN